MILIPPFFNSSTSSNLKSSLNSLPLISPPPRHPPPRHPPQRRRRVRRVKAAATLLRTERRSKRGMRTRMLAGRRPSLNPLPIRLEIPRQGLSNVNLKQRSFDRDLQGDDFMI